MSDEKQKSIFAKNFNRAMKSKNIRQIDIVNDLKINSSTVSSWSNGIMLPRPGKLKILAEYLGVSEAFLMGWTVSDEKIGDIFHNSTVENTVKTQRVSDKRKALDKKIDQLNDNGIQKMSDYADDIIKIPEYRKVKE